MRLPDPQMGSLRYFLKLLLLLGTTEGVGDGEGEGAGVLRGRGPGGAASEDCGEEAVEEAGEEAGELAAVFRAGGSLCSMQQLGYCTSMGGRAGTGTGISSGAPPLGPRGPTGAFRPAAARLPAGPAFFPSSNFVSLRDTRNRRTYGHPNFQVLNHLESSGYNWRSRRETRRKYSAKMVALLKIRLKFQPLAAALRSSCK